MFGFLTTRLFSLNEELEVWFTPNNELSIFEPLPYHRFGRTSESEGKLEKYDGGVRFWDPYF